MMIIIDCETCHGDGVRIATIEGERGEYFTREEECRGCDGSGRTHCRICVERPADLVMDRLPTCEGCAADVREEVAA